MNSGNAFFLTVGSRRRALSGAFAVLQGRRSCTAAAEQRAHNRNSKAKEGE